MLTLEVKAIIAVVLLAVLGYSYYWTYHQGQVNGSAKTLAVQTKALEDALRQNGLEAKALREKEMREAREIQDGFNQHYKRKIKQLEDANTALKQDKEFEQVCGSRAVPDAVLSVLNDAGTSSDPKG